MEAHTPQTMWASSSGVAGCGFVSIDWRGVAVFVAGHPVLTGPVAVAAGDQQDALSRWRHLACCGHLSPAPTPRCTGPEVNGKGVIRGHGGSRPILCAHQHPLPRPTCLGLSQGEAYIFLYYVFLIGFCTNMQMYSSVLKEDS